MRGVKRAVGSAGAPGDWARRTAGRSLGAFLVAALCLGTGAGPPAPYANASPHSARPRDAGESRALDPATESIVGTVRAQADPFCGGNCGSYYLVDDDGVFLVHLVGNAGSVGIYVDRTIETTGYRAQCGGCVSFYITGPVNIITAVSDDPGADPTGLPWTLRLSPNYPNPFNPSTVIPFSLTRQAEVTIVILDLLGREAAPPVEGLFSPGRHEISWDATGLPSGVYHCLVTAVPAGGPPATERRPMLLIR